LLQLVNPFRRNPGAKPKKAVADLDKAKGHIGRRSASPPRHSVCVLTDTDNGAAILFCRQESLGGSGNTSVESLRAYTLNVSNDLPSILAVPIP